MAKHEQALWMDSMGHSDISVTLNVYTHLGLQDAVEEMTRLQDLERAREEQERMDGENSADDEGSRMVI
ncbi:MAG: integrase [Oscillospiraceae bacterium]|nr:integrase [Oscillospiraceae bacterium]